MKQVACIAIIHDHHMLMGRRRESGKFTNPGGHLNPGEAPLKGAVREVKEETGMTLDPHLFKHLESKVVKKPDGEKIEVHAYRVDLRHKPSTTMVLDPDEEVQRWQWVKTDTDFSHIADNLHVPLKDNVLLTHILKDKPMRKHVRRFWEEARKIGVHGLAEEATDKALKEGPQQYFQYKEQKDRQKSKKTAGLIPGGESEGIPDTVFPKDQLRKGMKVEMEHTNSKEVAKEITKDHLAEKSKKPEDIKKNKYYNFLHSMENKMEKSAFWQGFEKKSKILPHKKGA